MTEARAARHWQRFTFRERFARYAVYLAGVAAVSLAARYIEVEPEFLHDAPAQVADLLVRMWPVHWRFLLSTVLAP